MIDLLGVTLRDIGCPLCPYRHACQGGKRFAVASLTFDEAHVVLDGDIQCGATVKVGKKTRGYESVSMFMMNVRSSSCREARALGHRVGSGARARAGSEDP